LVELAIGDAYGAAFEYSSNRMVREQNDLQCYRLHPRHGSRPGCYTDDTQMSIAVAEAMLSGESWTRELLADHFVAAFKRDPREGYARGFYAFLEEVQSGDEFLERIRPNSDKSGATMRAVPLGLFGDPGTVMRKCELQAKLTHDTPDGVRAAQAASLLSHFFVHNVGPKAEVAKFITDFVQGPWVASWSGKVGHRGIDSVHAAISAVVEHDALSSMLQACIAYTGDVDTVATIALGAASCSDEIDQDLPDALYDGLENDGYGLDYLRELDAKLAEARW